MSILLLVSLLPLCLIAVGASVVFRKLLMDSNLELQRTTVKSHASAIDLFLEERLRALDLIARMQPLERLAEGREINRLLNMFNSSYPNAFVDLGVIDSRGNHISYAGPYDLLDNNYSDTPWFKSVMSSGTFISDVFLGYRRVPHCVIAVRQKQGENAWILRATINNDVLFSLVKMGSVGDTGDAFILNEKGQYQTPPKTGKILDLSSVSALTKHQGVRDTQMRVLGTDMVHVTTWLNHNRWMLVVRRAEKEIMSSVHHAMFLGILGLITAVGLVIITTVLATRHLTKKIDRAKHQRDLLSRDLLRSAKLASLGEISIGLAHEINNPLAIIIAEQTNISDCVNDLNMSSPSVNDIIESVSRCKRQIERCGSITAKLLQFGRRTDAGFQLTDIAPLLKETINMMQKQAIVNNVDLHLDVRNALPCLLLDSNELEQILINLIGNGIQAIDKSGTIVVAAEKIESEVVLTVEDTGCGIRAEDLERIFQPFYTTKPVGKGTGLGLSVCYGIVQGWQGTIEASSEVGKGTIITVHLPIPKNEVAL